MVVENAPDVAIPVFGQPSLPVVVYTDDSLVGGLARIGIEDLVLGRRPAVCVYDDSPALRECCGESEHIINQAELLAASSLASSLPELVRNRDVLWLIDNSSAETALVRAESPNRTRRHNSPRGVAVSRVV